MRGVAHISKRVGQEGTGWHMLAGGWEAMGGHALVGGSGGGWEAAGVGSCGDDMCCWEVTGGGAHRRGFEQGVGSCRNGMYHQGSEAVGCQHMSAGGLSRKLQVACESGGSDEGVYISRRVGPEGGKLQG